MKRVFARFLMAFGLSAGVLAAHAFAKPPDVKPPAPCLPVPSKKQLAWEEAPAALYLRFGLSTFSGLDPTGKDDPKIFNPKQLDVKQWVQVAKDAGFNRIVFCAKDHDGFCLWPTKTTDYSIKKSPWKKGTGDVIKDLSDACHDAGLQLGVYCSCEDKNAKSYGSEDYDAMYVDQMKELLYNYGPIAEVRFDGAGGESGGALPSYPKNAPPAKIPYDFPRLLAIARSLQTDAVLVSNRGPDARWNGNNIGHCGEPNWAMFNLDAVPLLLNDRAQLSLLNSGDEAGKVWCSSETFIRDRPNWYWRQSEDEQVLDLDKLVSAYCKSAGRNSVFMLNVPINQNGLIPAQDAKRLADMHAALAAMFKTNLAAGQKISASNVRGTDDPRYAAENAIDGDPDTYWAPGDGVTGEGSLEIDFGKATSFDIAGIREPIALGQRIETYRLEIPDGPAKWKTVLEGKSIGRLKIERFPAVSASKVRLTIEKSRAIPLISEFSLYMK